ncbi:hypothetical protein [Streptomyces sp. NPDC053048]|uniref:hypothetical protein n=1 Tax=Streptomyces sp. NPDC053048 TaxID=3365694 RepID=UPI0037D3914A
MPEFRLGPPPERPGLGEFPAVVEPPVEDIPRPPAPPGPAQPVAWERTRTPSSEELLGRAAPALLADERARAALDGHRYVFLGASLLADDKDRTTPQTLVLVYDYTDERALEFVLDEGEPPRVTTMAESPARPGLSDAEVERATAIARTHSSVVRRAPADAVPMVLLTGDDGEDDGRQGRRRAYVGFGSPTRRLPGVRVVVDLGEERVLGAEGKGDE